MGLTNKTVLYSAAVGIFTFTSGFMWYLYKKKQESTAKLKQEAAEMKPTDTNIAVILTQSSDEGSAVTVLHDSPAKSKEYSAALEDSDILTEDSLHSVSNDVSHKSPVEEMTVAQTTVSNESCFQTVEDACEKTNQIMSNGVISVDSDIASQLGNVTPQPDCNNTHPSSSDISKKDSDVQQIEQLVEHVSDLTLDASIPAMSPPPCSTDSEGASPPALTTTETDASIGNVSQASSDNTNGTRRKDRWSSCSEEVLESSEATQVAASAPSNGSVTSTEQCQSSDSGVSLQSEQEVCKALQVLAYILACTRTLCILMNQSYSWGHFR